MSAFDPTLHPRGNPGHAGQFAAKAQTSSEVGLDQQEPPPLAASGNHLNAAVIAPLLIQLDMPADACRARLTSTRTEASEGVQQQLSIALDWKGQATDADTMAERMIFSRLLKRLIDTRTTHSVDERED